MLKQCPRKEIARAADVSVPTAQSWRDGKTQPKLGEVAALIEVFPALAEALCRGAGWRWAALHVREESLTRQQQELDLERRSIGLPPRARRA